MKKTLIAVITLTAALSIASCGKKSDSSDNSKPSVETTTEATQAITNQPDPLAPKTETTTTKTTTTAPITTTEAATQSSAPDEDAFSLDDNGAVVFEDESAQQDDRVLIMAAQALFESACTTHWNYTVGCPYTLNYDDFIENNFSWKFYRITNEGISSFDDVTADYCKVFSDRYISNELSSLYIEQNGAVYALDAARGMDLYYSESKIKGIESRSDDEIFFTVEHFFDGTDFDGSAPYSTTETFSVVINEDGSWRAGKFRLPY